MASANFNGGTKSFGIHLAGERYNGSGENLKAKGWKLGVGSISSRTLDRLSPVVTAACKVTCGLFFVAALLCGVNAPGLASFLGIGALVCLVVISSRHIVEKHFSVKLVMFSFILYALVVVAFHTPQTNDFWAQLEAARSFMAGNTEAFHTEYFEKWPDLPNYALVEVVLLSICDSDVFVQVFQAGCMSASLLFVYKLLMIFVSFRTASVSSMLLGLLPVFVLTVGSTTNQILSATLSLAAIYCFCCIRNTSAPLGHRLLGYIACGALLAGARFVRPDAVLVEVALLVVLLVSRKKQLGETGDKEGRLKIAAVLALSLSYLLIGAMLTGALYASGVYSERATGENVTFNKLLSGTDLESRGRVSSYYIADNEEKAAEKG